jgi:hypothetical protein
MVGLPLLKIGLVLFKEVSKPIASQIKRQAQGESRLMTEPFAAVVSQCTAQIK